MFFLNYRVKPTPENELFERVGEAQANCWIVRDTAAQARRFARAEIQSEGWEILEADKALTVTARNYPRGNPDREYYDQAKIDKDVIVYHVCPRHPVFLVVARVESKENGEVAEAMYFVSNEKVERAKDDVFDPGFWPSRQAAVLKAAKAMWRDAGWKVLEIVREVPCSRDELTDKLAYYYDQAEDAGECLLVSQAE